MCQWLAQNHGSTITYQPSPPPSLPPPPSIQKILQPWCPSIFILSVYNVKNSIWHDICHLSNQHAFKIMLMLHVFFIKHLKVSARLYLFIFKILFAGDGGLYIWTKRSVEILFCLLIRIYIIYIFFFIVKLVNFWVNSQLYIYTIIFVCLLWCVDCWNVFNKREKTLSFDWHEKSHK